MRAINLTGRRFGRLKVLEMSTIRNNGEISWVCECLCGKKIEVRGHSLRIGQTKSCGCFRSHLSSIRNRTHGSRHSPEYNCWAGMWQRCSNERSQFYDDYGGRGIKVCRRWNRFENFLADMGKRPYGMTLDRENNNGNYTPKNCRWSSKTTQARNRRGNIILSLNGVTMTAAEWSIKTGISIYVICWRVRRGWSAEKAITQPVRKMKDWRAEE